MTLKIKNKKQLDKSKQITDVISDVNLTLVLVTLGGFRGVKRKHYCDPRYFALQEKETKTNKSNVKEISAEFLLENTQVVL